MVIGKVPLHLGCTPQSAEIQNGKVRLSLQAADGSKRDIVTEHVIAATGYRVNMNRLKFLNAEIRSSLKTVDGSPVLSKSFESSIPGLFFAGVAAANSFGPVMRFAFGAGFAARTITRAFAKSVTRETASVAVRSVVTSSK
jgi:thioredoxin reductase